MEFDEFERKEFVRRVRQAILSLEKDGMVLSYVGVDGQVRWKLTEKGRSMYPTASDPSTSEDVFIVRRWVH